MHPHSDARIRTAGSFGSDQLEPVTRAGASEGGPDGDPPALRRRVGREQRQRTLHDFEGMREGFALSPAHDRFSIRTV